jgi:hypothetical protein
MENIMVDKIKAREIEEQTKHLRSSDDGLWVRIRHLLLEKGIKPDTTVVAYSFPEDYQYELGAIVTRDGRVYQFGFDFLQTDISNGSFKEWNDITENYERTSYKEEIEIAMTLVKEEDS